MKIGKKTRGKRGKRRGEMTRREGRGEERDERKVGREETTREGREEERKGKEGEKKRGRVEAGGVLTIYVMCPVLGAANKNEADTGTDGRGARTKRLARKKEKKKELPGSQQQKNE